MHTIWHKKFGRRCCDPVSHLHHPAAGNPVSMATASATAVVQMNGTSVRFENAMLAPVHAVKNNIAVTIFAVEYLFSLIFTMPF